MDIFVAPAEFKFADNQPGFFEGYGSVYGVLDSHKDVVEKGAFDASLEKHLKNGTMPALYVEHSKYVDGGDPLPVGVYTEIKSDDLGLRVKGKISNLDTDRGKTVYGLMKDGALKGLSIAFSVPAGGARMGKKQGEPKRTLTNLDLYSVDIVQSPSNSLAQVESLKSRLVHLKAMADAEEGAGDVVPDIDEAIAALAAAIMAQDQFMSQGGGYGYCSPKDQAMLMTNLQDAYYNLTGDRVPDGLTGWMKNQPFTIGTIRAALVDELGLSRKRADGVAKILFGKLPRDGGGAQSANTSDLMTSLAGLKDALK